MFNTSEISQDADAALVVLAEARRLAPCLDDLMSEDYETALAILRRAAGRASAAASTLKTRTAGDWSGTRFSPSEIGDAFLASDKRVLQGLCGSGAPSTGSGPVGCFPPPSRPFRP